MQYLLYFYFIQFEKFSYHFEVDQFLENIIERSWNEALHIGVDI